MLPEKFYKHFGLRIKLTKFAMGTYYQWDAKTEQLIIAPAYMIYGMYSAMICGWSLALLDAIDMYQKAYTEDIPEENSQDSKVNIRDIATSMIQIGESLLLLCFNFMNYIFLTRIEIFMFLFNELLNLNKKITEMTNSGKMVLTARQQQVVRLTIVILYFVLVISVFLPVFVLAIVSSPIEPHNQILRNMLEIPIELSWQTLPLIIILSCTVYSGGTFVGLMCMVICLYYMVTTICTEAFTPEQMYATRRDGAGRCAMLTPGFGVKSDLEVIQMYRTQQMLNVLLCKFFRSILIAYHHVGVLATVVVLFAFAVKYHSILDEIGPISYFLVFSCMFSALLVIYLQCKMAGAVVDISDFFKDSGSRIFQRKTLFRKFTKSCTTFYIEVTYPFYTIHTETFTMFGEQVIDWSMHFLLS